MCVNGIIIVNYYLSDKAVAMQSNHVDSTNNECLMTKSKSTILLKNHILTLKAGQQSANNIFWELFFTLLPKVCYTQRQVRLGQVELLQMLTYS